MQKSTLALYIQKVAAGDRSFAERLCGQLADRLLYVPTTAQAKSGAAVKISIQKIIDAGTPCVPVFTSDKKFRAWCAHTGRPTESIALLGADLCSALGEAAHIWVDPGCDPNIKLGPDFVEQIAVSGGTGNYAEAAKEARSEPPPPTERTTEPPPKDEPIGLAGFPSGPPAETAYEEPVPTTAPRVSPSPRGSPPREEFPPFVPPGAGHPPADPPPPAPRGVDVREPPIGDTIRRARTSLATGAVMGTPPEPPPTPPTTPESPERSPDQKGKKGLFGLFSKK